MYPRYCSVPVLKRACRLALSQSAFALPFLFSSPFPPYFISRAISTPEPRGRPAASSRCLRVLYGTAGSTVCKKFECAAVGEENNSLMKEEGDATRPRIVLLSKGHTVLNYQYFNSQAPSLYILYQRPRIESLEMKATRTRPGIRNSTNESY